MPYERQVDRDHPSCIVVMVDQSDSMRDPLAGDRTRSKQSAVADILNGLLYELVLRCVKSPQEGPRSYFAVGVIGYCTAGPGSNRIRSAFSPPLDAADVAWTPDLAANPLRVDLRTAPSGSGQVSSPVWIEPHASGGTPMCGAFDRAGRLVAGWLQRYPASFPPIVMNLTDGQSTDGDPAPWAERLRLLSSDDGPVLLFNLHLSGTEAAPVLFPSSGVGLADEYSQALFQMSSELPPFMLDAARAQGSPVEPGTRGFGFNADLRSIMTFLNVGTSVGKVLR